MEHHKTVGPGARRRPRSPPPARPRPQSDPALRPASPHSSATARVEVRAAEPPEHVFRRLLGAYLGGAPEFLVHEAPSLRATTRGIVRTFARRTRQPEIVSDDGDAILLRDLAFDSPVPLERRLEQMGKQVIRFHQEAVASWAVLPFGEDDSWEHRDDEIDREAWYLERKARLRLGRAPPSLELWVVARSLERIADHAVILGEAGRRLAGLPHGEGPLATLGQFHAQAMEHLAGVLATGDEAGANELLDTGEALLASGRAISDRLLPAGPGAGLSPAAAAAVARILESIQRTVAYGQDVAQVVLDRTLDGAAVPTLVPAASGALPAR